MAPIHALTARSHITALSGDTPAVRTPTPGPATSPARDGVADSFERSGADLTSRIQYGASPVAAKEKLKYYPTLRTGAGDDTVDIRMGADQRIHVKVNGKESWSGTAEQFSRLTIDTGAGNDRVNNHVDGAHISTGDGDDHVFNHSAGSRIDTGAGADTVDNRGSRNTIDTGSGDDDVTSRGEANHVFTGRGGDRVDSTGDSNVIDGNDGADVLASHGDLNQVYGGAGDDVVDGRGDDNHYDGGEDTDTMRSAGDRNLVTGGAGTDRFHVEGNHNQTPDAFADFVGDFWGR